MFRWYTQWLPRLTVGLWLMLLMSVRAGAQTSYRIVPRPPFVYYYAGEDERFLGQLDEALQSLRVGMETTLGATLPDEVRIDLPPSRSEFVRITGGRAPEWAGGIAYPDRRRIVIRPAHTIPGGVPISVTAAHEIGHILIHVANGGQGGIPKWLEEGLCQVLAGESRAGSLGALGRAAVANRLMGLPRIDDVLQYSAPNAELAYIEARYAAGSFVERFGWESVRRLLQETSPDRPFDAVFHAVTGVEYEYWQAEWLEKAQERYRGLALLDLDNLIWIGIVLLAMVAVIAVWIRKRIQFRKWLEEEDDDETPVDPSDEPIHPH